jgi:hypothetical protein
MNHKHVLIFAALLASVSLTASAEIKELESEKTHGIHTFCIDGYKYVLITHIKGVSIIQAYEENKGKAVPARC